MNMGLLSHLEFGAMMIVFISSGLIFYYVKKLDVNTKEQQSYALWIKSLAVISMAMMALITTQYLM